MKSIQMIFATAAAIEISVSDVAGEEIAARIFGDHARFNSNYENLTRSIIDLGRRRVSNGLGCKHIGFRMLSDGRRIDETCEDACIWAGGAWVFE